VTTSNVYTIRLQKPNNQPLSIFFSLLQPTTVITIATTETFYRGKYRIGQP